MLSYQLYALVIHLPMRWVMPSPSISRRLTHWVLGYSARHTRGAE